MANATNKLTDTEIRHAKGKDIRARYTNNRLGHALTLRNAKGKGAANVIDHAIKLQT